MSFFTAFDIDFDTVASDSTVVEGFGSSLDICVLLMPNGGAAALTTETTVTLDVSGKPGGQKCIRHIF